jgi:hypothetical protein
LCPLITNHTLNSSDSINLSCLFGYRYGSNAFPDAIPLELCFIKLRHVWYGIKCPLVSSLCLVQPIFPNLNLTMSFCVGVPPQPLPFFLRHMHRCLLCRIPNNGHSSSHYRLHGREACPCLPTVFMCWFRTWVWSLPCHPATSGVLHCFDTLDIWVNCMVTHWGGHLATSVIVDWLWTWWTFYVMLVDQIREYLVVLVIPLEYVAYTYTCLLVLSLGDRAKIQGRFYQNFWQDKGWRLPPDDEEIGIATTVSTILSSWHTTHRATIEDNSSLGLSYPSHPS